MTASPSTNAAVATHGGATLPDMPANVATAADVVAIIARHLAVAEYIASSTPGGDDGVRLSVAQRRLMAATEGRALRWLLATISDHAQTVGREAGIAADAAWVAAEENAVASEQPILTSEERRPLRAFSRLHQADALVAEERFLAAGELATAISELLYP